MGKGGGGALNCGLGAEGRTSEAVQEAGPDYLFFNGGRGHFTGTA